MPGIGKDDRMGSLTMLLNLYILNTWNFLSYMNKTVDLMELDCEMARKVSSSRF